MKSEQSDVAQKVYDNYGPLFSFLSNQAWFKTQLASPVPGAGPNNAFGAVVPNGVNGGPANLAENDDRWQWIGAPGVGMWDAPKTWESTHFNINAADVTNTGLMIPWPLPTGQDIAALVNWQPPV